MESRDGRPREGYEEARRWRGAFAADGYDDLVARQRGCLHSEIYSVATCRAGEILVSVQYLIDAWSPQRQVFSQNPYGHGHARFGFFQDGFNRRYPRGRPAWMERGEPGSLDAGFLEVSSNFVDDEDHLLLYYAGSRYRHGWFVNEDVSLRDLPRDDEWGSSRMMPACIKRDRFASLASTCVNRFDVDADFRFNGDGAD